MISREEKNKKYVDEIKKEKTKKITKYILKIFGVFLGVFSLIFLYSYFIEPNRFEVHEYMIKDISIPDEFNGKKILHLSDILYGITIDENKLNEIANEVKLINPDIVIFTGNMISKDYNIGENEIKTLNKFFKDIPYTIGKYAVNGDIDKQNFHLILENTDFRLLNNESIEVYNGVNKINVIGISYDDDKEIKNIDGYTIALINNYDDYSKLNITSNIILSGHNLGGEIRLFGLPLLGTDKHLNSYYKENNTNIYISNGLGSPRHLRLMNKPSMNVYRLYNK